MLQGMLEETGTPQQPQQLAEVLERIDSLATDIETGRASVLAAHRAVLDCSDGAIARVRVSSGSAGAAEWARAGGD